MMYASHKNQKQNGDGTNEIQPADRCKYLGTQFRTGTPLNVQCVMKL